MVAQFLWAMARSAEFLVLAQSDSECMMVWFVHSQMFGLRQMPGLKKNLISFKLIGRARTHKFKIKVYRGYLCVMKALTRPDIRMIRISCRAACLLGQLQ